MSNNNLNVQKQQTIQRQRKMKISKDFCYKTHEEWYFQLKREYMKLMKQN